MKKGFVTVLLLVLLIVVSSAFAYYFGIQQKQKTKDSSSQVVDVPEDLKEGSVSPSPVSNVPSGWKTFVSEEYGFKVSYPPAYKALTDKENLYGWPNAIVLIYGGGQSYDLVIEHWSTQAEYENKYKNQPNITVKKVGNYYITMLNANFESEVDQMIATFEITN